MLAFVQHRRLSGLLVPLRRRCCSSRPAQPVVGVTPSCARRLRPPALLHGERDGDRLERAPAGEDAVLTVVWAALLDAAHTRREKSGHGQGMPRQRGQRARAGEQSSGQRKSQHRLCVIDVITSIHTAWRLHENVWACSWACSASCVRRHVPRATCAVVTNKPILSAHTL